VGTRNLLIYLSRYILTRRQWKGLFDLRVKLPPVTTCQSQTTQR